MLLFIYSFILFRCFVVGEGGVAATLTQKGLKAVFDEAIGIALQPYTNKEEACP